MALDALKRHSTTNRIQQQNKAIAIQASSSCVSPLSHLLNNSLAPYYAPHKGILDANRDPYGSCDKPTSWIAIVRQTMTVENTLHRARN